LPRDYFDPPDAFGFVAGARARPAGGGDATSTMVAQIQHDLVLAWRAGGCRPSGAALGRRFGFSKQTWSRAMLGQRWMGETLMAALLHVLRASARSANRTAGGSR
jgi:hypothetical protein